MGTVSVSDLLGNKSSLTNNIALSSSINNSSIINNINNSIDIESVSAGLGKLLLNNSIVHIDNLSIPYNEFNWSNISIDFNNIISSTNLNNSLKLDNNISTSNTNNKINISLTNNTKDHKLYIELPQIDKIPINDIYTFNDKFSDALYKISNSTFNYTNNAFSLQTYDSLKSLINPFIKGSREIVNAISAGAAKWIDNNLTRQIGIGVTLTAQAVGITDGVINILNKFNRFSKDSLIDFSLNETLTNAFNDAKNIVFGDQSFINMDSQKYSWFNITKNGATEFADCIKSIINIDKKNRLAGLKATARLAAFGLNLTLNILAKFQTDHNKPDLSFGNIDFNKDKAEDGADRLCYKVLMNRTRLDSMHNTFNTGSNWYIEIVPYNRFAAYYDDNNDPVGGITLSDNSLPPSLYDSYKLTPDNRYQLPIESYQIVNDCTNVLSFDMYPFDSTKIFTNSIVQKAESLVLNVYDYFPRQNVMSALDDWKSKYISFVNYSNKVITTTTDNTKNTSTTSINYEYTSRFYQDCCYVVALYRYNGRYDYDNYIYSIEKFLCLPYGIKTNRSGSSTSDGVIIDQLNFYIVGRLKSVTDILTSDETIINSSQELKDQQEKARANRSKSNKLLKEFNEDGTRKSNKEDKNSSEQIDASVGTYITDRWI